YDVIDDEMIGNSSLQKIVNTYRIWYEEKLQPGIKNFLYSEDAELSKTVLKLVEFPYDISPGWMKNYEMPVPTREDNYKREIISTLNYLELKKIKKLISLNEKELEHATSPERQILLIQTHNHLKNMEIKITNEMGMVILK
ncbi:MAG: hypothetical protein ABI683_09690, partial [Ginsengibacter sp.]